MALLTLRSTRDSALTWEEGDANLLALDSDSPWKVSANHITYDGKVGISVDSTYTPVYDLDFGNGDSATVGITNGDLAVHVDGPNELKVWNNTVQSITVKTTGKVGINDSDPSEMLTVGGNLRVSDTALANVMSANSLTDGVTSISAGNITTVKRLDVFDATVEIQFGNLYSKISGIRILDWDSDLTNQGDKVPTSRAVTRSLNYVNDTLNAQFDSFETQINADFNSLELNLTNQIDSLDTSLNLQITNLINDQNEAFDSLELSLNTQINNLELSIQNQIDSLDTSLNLQITNLINDQNEAFDSLEGSINNTLSGYDFDTVLALGNISTLGFTAAASTFTGAVNVTGQLTATGDVVAFSDIAVKEDINPIGDALDKVSQLGGYTFKRKDDDSRKYTGVIAQEIQKVLPEAVHSSDQGLSVAYGNLTGLLIEAVKELSAKVKELESK